MQNSNLIGWSSVHNSHIFNCYRANISGMWNARKRGGVYKTFWVYANLKHTWYMRNYRVKQHLIVLKLDSVSVNEILVTKFVTVKVSRTLNLMQSLSKQWNQQLSWYVFSEVIKCLEQNVRKQIDCKETIADQTNELNTKYSCWYAEI